ncbi:DUF3347 domain-containing protein [Flavobacterium paronense]|uniref:DUF3347 domain-containing protein n=1 Tax=Flavobacterium paronense TaxID=1392775 RepID=A0ABV5GBK0_9FLAO|nr:DUF3347 domain-containing protein [Flavobacterium paronense]MDN3677672.1 DUF3347 domain-containing protein [Flavobacterium paronense]
MKNIMISAIVMVFVLVSCNQKSKETEVKATEKADTNSQLYACSMHPEVTGKKGEKCSKCGMELTEPVTQKIKNVAEPKSTDTVAKVEETAVTSAVTSSDYVTDIITCYINLKNKLAKDDSKGAADKGKMLLESFNRFDTKTLNAKQKKDYLDIADDAKEHAEHIGANGDKLEHQREHFVLLSKDINDLIKMFGSNRKLYQDYCPMANDGKGAIWISEVKEIKNPYQGNKMLTCGTVKKTY